MIDIMYHSLNLQSLILKKTKTNETIKPETLHFTFSEFNFLFRSIIKRKITH